MGRHPRTRPSGRRAPPPVEDLIRDGTEFIGKARRLEPDKAPGLAETIDWVSALARSASPNSPPPMAFATGRQGR